MATFSLHGFSFFRHLRRRNTLICFCVFIIYYVSGAKCASITNSSEKPSAEDLGSVKSDNNTLARRQLLPGEQILALNPYIPGLQLGYPAASYQNVHSFQPGMPFPQITTLPASKPASTQSQKKRIKVKTSKGEVLEPVSTEDKKQAEKSVKDKKEKRKKEKLQREADKMEKVESKTVEEEKESGRGCPACEGGPCDPFLDTKNNISGIPLIQLLVALAVGAFWAAVFAFVLFNFIDHHKDQNEGGYGYDSNTPEYGVPSTEYGASTQYGAPQSEYGSPTGYNGNHRISNGYGSRSQNYNFNTLSKWVWGAIDTLARKYDS